MTSNHGVCSDETGATKGPLQHYGSGSNPPAFHTNRLIKYLRKKITSQRSSGHKPPISTLANNGAVWRLLDSHDGISMAPLQTTPGKRTPAKYVARPPPEPQPPHWPPPPRPWPSWPALNAPTAPRNSTFPAEVDSVRLLLPFQSCFSGAIRDAALSIPPTTIPLTMATNCTTKSEPTPMGQAIKTRPHHQFLPYVYPLPQLPPPLRIPPWPPSPHIQRKDGTNRAITILSGTVSATFIKNQKPYHLRRN